MRDLLGQSIRFAVVGLVNTAIGLAAIYAVLYFGHTGPVIANAVGYALGLAVSFLLNRLWTFKDPSPIRSVLLQYVMVAALSYALNLAIVLSAIHGFGVNAYLSQLLGICAYTGVMFFGCRWFVFKTPHVASSSETFRAKNL